MKIRVEGRGGVDFWNAFASWPLPLRMTLIFAVGVLVATQLNRGIYRLAWHARQIGPWSPPHPDAPPRRALDRLPVLGWCFLRREVPLHGRGFWVRPVLIELAMGSGLALLYWYEVDQAGLVGWAGFPVTATTLHQQFVLHAVLMALMVVATFIDFDEQTIPDAITIPGALMGLSLAALLPQSRLLVQIPAPNGFRVDLMHLASGTAMPARPDWPAWLDGTSGLMLGLLALLAWWFAILPWTWTTRRGWRRAFAYASASLWRRTGRLLPALAAAAAVGILLTWLRGGENWESLLSSLVGMVFGGGIIWAIRVAGTRALGQEAMGFGDVTLMAMIGSFTGWQPVLMIFFLAPVSAVFISVAQWLLTGRKDIAFGPYLCLATVFVLVRWPWLWDHWGRPVFTLGWMVPLMFAGCVVLIWAMLTVMRFLRELRE